MHALKYSERETNTIFERKQDVLVLLVHWAMRVVELIELGWFVEVVLFLVMLDFLDFLKRILAVFDVCIRFLRLLWFVLFRFLLDRIRHR